MLVAAGELSTDAQTSITAAWERLNSDTALSQLFVLKSDWFRLVVVYLYGGWWLDADAVCIDGLRETFGHPSMQRAARHAQQRARAELRSEYDNAEDMEEEDLKVDCVFAWENDVSHVLTNPLNWAFGCRRHHPFLLAAIELSSRRINAWHYDHAPKSELQFTVPVRTWVGSTVLVDVLHLTGPSLLGAALGRFAAGPWDKVGRHGIGWQKLLRDMRQRVTKEIATDKATWARATFFKEGAAVLNITSQCDAKGGQECHPTLATPDSGAEEVPGVLVLPVCFFRSRGCEHLFETFGDRVMFHHEFETSW